jgi:DNA-binding NtrC family response regulator
MGAAVLYVVPGSSERVAVRDRLVRSGVPLAIAADLPDAVSQLALRQCALCLLDLVDERLALSAIRLLRTQHPQQPLAGVVDPAHPLVAGQAVQAGLIDLLPWPFEDRDLHMLISNAADRRGVEVEVSRPGTAAEALFAQAPAMRPVLDAVRLAASHGGGVCISGEPGTGRELVARVIHGVSERAGRGAFVMLDCRTPPPDLERRLFGTTMDRRATATPRAGAPDHIAITSALAQARGGMLYLTGLIEAPARVQARLARLLRDGEAIVEGADECVDLDLQPVGSFEPGFDAALADGHLRRDLYERIAHTRIDLPPLRRRRQDIPLLAAHFLNEVCARHGLGPRSLSRSALALLSALPWQGNAGELRALLEAVAPSVRRPVIDIDDLLEHASLDGLSARIETGTTLRDARARFERECISAVLIRHHGRVGDAARALGIQRTNLYRKVRQLNVARSLLSARK